MKDEVKKPVEIIGGQPYYRDEVELDYFEKGLAEGLAAQAKKTPPPVMVGRKPYSEAGASVCLCF